MLKVWWPYATLFAFIFLYTIQYIHSCIIHSSFIHKHSLRPISIFSQLSAQWAEPPWGAEPRFELGPALQKASALPTEPRCTLFLPIYELCNGDLLAGNLYFYNIYLPWLIKLNKYWVCTWGCTFFSEYCPTQGLQVRTHAEEHRSYLLLMGHWPI
jgi:hypothetical protein